MSIRIHSRALRPGPLAVGLGLAVAALGIGEGIHRARSPVAEAQEKPTSPTSKGPTAEPGKAASGIEASKPPAGSQTFEEPRPSPKQMEQNARPASNAKAVTDYVIFKNVTFGKGIVQTGWHYSDNQQENPDHQFCQYLERMNSTSRALVMLGSNGRFEQPEAPPASLDVSAAFSNCVWKNVPT